MWLYFAPRVVFAAAVAVTGGTFTRYGCKFSGQVCRIGNLRLFGEDMPRTRTRVLRFPQDECSRAVWNFDVLPGISWTSVIGYGSVGYGSVGMAELDHPSLCARVTQNGWIVKQNYFHAS
jgi:hypothetical protein